MAEGYDSKNISNFKEQCQDLMNMLQVKVDNLGQSTTQTEMESPNYSVFSPLGTPIEIPDYNQLSPRTESTRLTENLTEPYPHYDEESVLPSFYCKSRMNTREIYGDGLVDENDREIESPRYKALPQSYFNVLGHGNRDARSYQAPQNTSQMDISSRAPASHPNIVKHFSKDNTQTRHVSFQQADSSIVLVVPTKISFLLVMVVSTGHLDPTLFLAVKINLPLVTTKLKL